MTPTSTTIICLTTSVIPLALSNLKTIMLKKERGKKEEQKTG